jgi:hypothetical protein
MATEERPHESPAEESPSQRGPRKGAERTALGVGVLVLLAVLAMVNYLSGKYYRRFDWTQAKIYTLSEKSRGVVQGLAKDVQATLFMRADHPLYGPVRELLERYQAASPRFRTRSVDPELNLLEAQRLAEGGVRNPNVVVFESGGERRVLDGIDLADFDYSGEQMGQAPRLVALKAEQKFTGALLELAESRKPHILFTSGHGELSIDATRQGGLTQVRQLLGQDNFELEEWPTLGKTAVPEGVDLIVLAAPRTPFALPELALLAGYLESGGRLLVLLDPEVGGAAGLAGSQQGLVRWLSGYGVVVGDDVVVDPSNPLPFFGAETIYSSFYGIHPVTKSLRQADAAVILSLARSVRRSDPPPTDREAIELVTTGPEGWGETDLANLGAVAKDVRDLAGPVSIAVAVGPKATDAAPDAADPSAEKPDPSHSQAPETTGMRLVVFGDSDWMSDAQIANAGNAILAADVFNWLVARPQLLGIPAKTPESNRLNLQEGQLRWIFVLVMAVMPLAAVAAGVLVYLRRRR